jgi:lipopolysaccharide export system permease protein
MTQNSNSRTDIDIPVTRQFRIMPTLDLYILKEFLIIYSCVTIAFCVLFTISNIINKLGDFTVYDASWLTIGYYFLLKLPGDIKFVLPISLLLSTIYTMAKFGMNNEITAMRASGVSLFRCGVSLYIIGLIVTGVNFWFNASLAPNCIREAQVLKEIAKNPNYIQEKTRMLVYRTPNGMRTWLIKSFISNNEQARVQIKKYDKKGTLELELYAKKSKYSPKSGWKFIDVKIVRYKKIFLTNDYSTSTQGKEQTIIVPISKTFKVLDKATKEFLDLGHIFETPADFINVITPPEEWSSADIISVLERAEGLQTETRSYYKTILYTRWTFPWVCLFCVFFGIPLAANNERRGIIVSVASAVGIVIIYQVVSQVFMVLGQKAYLPSIIAGTAPTIVLALYVWYFMNKYR